MSKYKSFVIVYFGLIVLLSSMSSLSACTYNINVSQELLSEGFHRNLTYTVTFLPPYPNIRPYNDCLIGIYQTLPPGIYANPDELSELKRAHRLSAITRKTNIELPADQATPTTVYITARINGPKVETWLPLHARYHKAVDFGGYTMNQIEAPSLYLRCPDARLDQCMTLKPARFICSVGSKHMCNWKAVAFAMETLSPVQWMVPVGDRLHYYPVAISTGLVVTFSSFYLLYTLHDYKTNYH